MRKTTNMKTKKPLRASPATHPAAATTAPRRGAVVEPLEGRHLMAAHIAGLELWTAGKAVDTKQLNIPSKVTTTYDVAAAGHTTKLDLLVKTAEFSASSAVNFQVYSPVFKADASTLISQGTENDPAYVVGGNQGGDFQGRLRGPRYGSDKQAAPYTLLALNGAESRRFVVRVKVAGRKAFTEFILVLNRNGATTPAVKPTVTSVRLLNAAGTPLFGDGTVKLDDSSVFRGLLGKGFTLVVAGTNVASVKLDLRTDGVSGFQRENFKPFSLYGDKASGGYSVRSVKKAGTYTLFLDAFSAKGFAGTETHEEVSFRVID